jgi:hypothetical protein
MKGLCIRLPFASPDSSTVTTEVSDVLQVPPASPEADNTVVEPSQTVVVPDIDPAFGNGFTVINWIATSVPQPFVMLYEIVALPAATPVTSPVELTEAFEDELLHVPPVVPDADKEVDAPTQTNEAPVIVPADGNGLTVIEEVATSVPQPVVTL